MPGGPLEVPQGNVIVPVINKVQSYFDLVVATQDWHPKNHTSFASNHPDKKPFDKISFAWTDSKLFGPIIVFRVPMGAEFHHDLESIRFATIFRKGMDTEVDSYSGFYDNNHQLSTGLSGYLKDKGVTDVYFCGLAADICVYYTILDSILEGFTATLIEDASRPLFPDKFDDIKCELAKQGVRIITSHDIR